MATYKDDLVAAKRAIVSNWKNQNSKPLLFAKVETKFGAKYMLDYVESEFRPGLELIEDLRHTIDDMCDNFRHEAVDLPEFQASEEKASEEKVSKDKEQIFSGITSQQALTIAYCLMRRLSITLDKADVLVGSEYPGEFDRVLNVVKSVVEEKATCTRPELIEITRNFLNGIVSDVIWYGHRGQVPKSASTAYTALVLLATSAFSAMGEYEQSQEAAESRLDSASRVFISVDSVLLSDEARLDVNQALRLLNDNLHADPVGSISDEPFQSFDLEMGERTAFPQLGEAVKERSIELRTVEDEFERLPRWALVALGACYVQRGKEIAGDQWIDARFDPVLEHLQSCAVAGKCLAMDVDTLKKNVMSGAWNDGDTLIESMVRLCDTGADLAQLAPSQLPSMVQAMAFYLSAIAAVSSLDSDTLVVDIGHEVVALYNKAAEENWDDQRPVTLEQVRHFWQDGAPTNTSSDCFVATACYNNGDHADVMALRHWRDRVLMRNMYGRGFVWLYYRCSPPFARWLRDREAEKFFIRTRLLEPLVAKIQNNQPR
ncbi:MAG: hypothetical protein GXP16_12345 [Gammaproteobacteria bacterium]|nr:hypothetical protein [Gammaproteobacteria bacterium]